MLALVLAASLPPVLSADDAGTSPKGEADAWERPRSDDEDGNRGSGSSSGPVLTQLGLAGQPVDQDPDFGTLPLGGGGVGSGSGGFGAALVQDSNTGLKVPLNDAADRVGSRVDAQLDRME